MCRKHCVVQKLKMYVDARMSVRFLCMCIYMHALIRCVCMCFFSPVYVVRMNKKIKKKLGGVHGIQSVSDLANIVPSVWPVWLNVMLACCVDSNLKKKKKLCHFPTVRVFFFFLLRKHLHRTNKKKRHVAKP